jgi:hypothetical protein
MLKLIDNTEVRELIEKCKQVETTSSMLWNKLVPLMPSMTMYGSTIVLDLCKDQKQDEFVKADKMKRIKIFSDLFSGS